MRTDIVTGADLFGRLLGIEPGMIQLLHRGQDLCVRGLSTAVDKRVFVLTRMESDVRPVTAHHYTGPVFDVRPDSIVEHLATSKQLGTSASGLKLFAEPTFVLVWDQQRHCDASDELVLVLRRLFVSEMADPAAVLQAYESAGLCLAP